jgi:hypothetical protein
MFISKILILGPRTAKDAGRVLAKHSEFDRFRELCQHSFSTFSTGTAKYDLNQLNRSNSFREWLNKSHETRIASNDLSHLKSCEEPIQLKDGTQARSCILTIDNLEEVEEFYANLSDKTISAIKESTCAYRNYGKEAADYQSYRFLANLGTCVSLGIRTNVNGKCTLVAISFFLRLNSKEENTACRPFGTVVRDGFQNKGVGVALKIAQIRCALKEGFSTMENAYLSDAVVKTWRGACKELDLNLIETSHQVWHGTEIIHRIHLRNANATLQRDSKRDGKP